MGIGDEIMASGHARSEYERTGKRVRILDREMRPRWDDLWDGLPWIARPHELGDFAAVSNAPGCRPYLHYPWNAQSGQRFTGWRARDHVGAIALRPEELRFAERVAAELGPFVVIEPTIAEKSNQNKQWGRDNWWRLVQSLSAQGVRVVRLSPKQIVAGWNGLHHIQTRTFRDAAAVLARASLSILPEGGLHHAAGVLGAPAVVLFGGTISPETTGYALHVNVAASEAGSPCGAWSTCAHCQGIWSRLAPERVAEIAMGELNARRAA